jgi:putative transposase
MRKSYSTDISDEQWEIIKVLLPAPAKVGRPISVNLREVINAILYQLKHGVSWEDLPHDFPNHNTVRWYYDCWCRISLWEKINDALVPQVREHLERNAQPSAALLDSQSVKNSADGCKGGYDAAKNVHGAKRNSVVDTQGLLLNVLVTPANEPERVGGAEVLRGLKEKQELSASIKTVVCDQGYDGAPFATLVKDSLGWDVKVVKREEKQKGFKVLHLRWIVERTFSWFYRCKGLLFNQCKSFEAAKNSIYICSVRLMLRRLTGQSSKWRKKKKL